MAPHLLPWLVLVVVGGVLLFRNGLDPTASLLTLVGLLGGAVATIRVRWEGAALRLARRLAAWRRARTGR